MSGLILNTDITELSTLINALSGDIEKADNEALEKVLKALFSLPDFLKELISIQGDLCSTGARELLVTLNPSNSFLRLAAAVRAGDINALIVEHERFLSGVHLSSDHIGKGLMGVTGYESSN